MSQSRREFLRGRGQPPRESAAADELALPAPTGSARVVRLETNAMACTFAVLLNAGPAESLIAASYALDTIHELESQLSVYRPETELSQLNRRAPHGPVEVEPALFELLCRARDISRATEGAYDPTAGPLVALWRRCRLAGQAPSEAEVAAARERVGLHQVTFDESARTIQFSRPGVELNLNSLGKGYALDVAARHLSAAGVRDWLFSGGSSSILTSGALAGSGVGDVAHWPVGLRDPLFPRQECATLRLRGQAMSTSGSGVQFFRYRGRRYGHLLDPRTGWPVDGMLSATAFAPTAAEADAYSTAFYVWGVEKSRTFCHNNSQIAAILVPPPRRGRTLEPVVCNLDPEQVVWSSGGSSEGQAT